MIGPKAVGADTAFEALSMQLPVNVVPEVSAVSVAAAMDVSGSSCVTTAITPAGSPLITG